MHRRFRAPLARYGFTALALLALANGLILPAVVCAAIALYAWKTR